MTTQPGSVDRLDALLRDASASTRMQAALTAGSRPDPSFVEVLIGRCAAEPDFTVRDTLTWAITRHDSDLTVPRLLADPDEGFEAAVFEAQRVVALRDAPTVADDDAMESPG